MLLLLAGTREARDIAGQLADAGIDAIASLAGATRDPAQLAIKTRIGGYGGAEEFAAFLVREKISAILDATHPFAENISQRTFRIATQSNVPYCQLMRPEWLPESGDRWTMIETEDQAAKIIRPGATVFLATGRQTLERFSGLQNCHLICRQIDPPEHPFPFANGEFLVGRPPFSVGDEMRLFKTLEIDWLVVKNAGGEASRSKLIAARQLGIPVLMLSRPRMNGAKTVETIADAMAWISGQQ